MNLWVYPLLILWTLIGALISLPLLFIAQLFGKWPIAKRMHLFIWIYARVCILIVRPFIRLEIEGMDMEKMPCRHGIFVMNHYSFFDTYMLSLLPVFDVHICAKSWPFKMFWYSFFMRLAEYIDVESLSWEEILGKAKKFISKGKSIVIFPEGHRSRTGKQGRFHLGAFKLAIQLNSPIFPVCITGTQALLKPGQIWFRPATIKMRLLNPVPPNQFHGERSYAEMRSHVRYQIMESIERMESKNTDAD